MQKESAHAIVTFLQKMAPGSRLANAVEFFIYDIMKIFLLLSVIIFIVSIIRSYFPPEKTKRILSHRKQFIGNILAAIVYLCSSVVRTQEVLTWKSKCLAQVVQTAAGWRN